MSRGHGIDGRSSGPAVANQLALGCGSFLTHPAASGPLVCGIPARMSETRFSTTRPSQ